MHPSCLPIGFLASCNVKGETEEKKDSSVVPLSLGVFETFVFATETVRDARVTFFVQLSNIDHEEEQNYETKLYLFLD